jgi:hypothetical protein
MTSRRRGRSPREASTPRPGSGPCARTLRLLSLTVLPCLSACHTQLPEPQSPGAVLYASRCNTCHRLYAPGSMTYEMWKIQVERMQGEMVRRGVPPLTPEQSVVLLDYLKRHSG